MVHVLVVDDERDFADILSERLRTRGMDAATAYNGQQALQHARSVHPDVVVLDITMPGMSGLDTLVALKTLSPRTEIILLTADSTVSTAVNGMKLGASDYLIKPAVFEDLTAAIGDAEARRMENLSRQRMAETAKLAALGELGTGVAHEINNPVHIMVNEAGLIADLLNDVVMDANTDAEIRASLHQISVQARRCKAITSKLLTLRPAPDTQAASVTLPDTVRTLLEERRTRMENAGIKTDEHWDKILDTILFRQADWVQVLANIIDNALDAMDHQGGVLTIRGATGDDGLTVSVEDSGCGIESHLLTRIFEPFFSTKEVGKGIGLGLAICHGIVEAMGGSILVRSTPGHGSTFTIKTPMPAHGRIEHTAPEATALTKEEHNE